MSFTNAQLAQKIADLISYWSSFNEEYANWLGGVVGGGPGLDGKYPLTDYTGNTALVKSPAQLEADVSGQVDSAAASAAAASSSATAAAGSASTATTQAGLADTARIAAETARTQAQTAETGAVDAKVTAIAQANIAVAKATEAAASAAAALISENNAAASELAAAASAAAAATFVPANYYAKVDGVPWADITSKPATFTPSAHTHVKADITDFAHTHVAADVTDFGAAVDARAGFGTTAPGSADTYLYRWRNSTSPLLYIRQAGTGPIARFFQSATAGASSGTSQLEVTNDGGLTATGAVSAPSYSFASGVWQLGRINDDSLFLKSNHASAIGLALRDNTNTSRGYLYATGDGVGFLNNAASWSWRVSNSGVLSIGTVPWANLSDVSTKSPFNAPNLGSGTNLDTLQLEQSGFYYQPSNAATSGNNYPSGEAGSLLVQRSAASGGVGATQLYQTYDSTPELFFRSAYGTWSSWRKVWHTGNFDPASYLPLTGGTVTGATTFTSSDLELSGHWYTGTWDGTNVYFHVGRGTGSTNKVLNLRVHNSANSYAVYTFSPTQLALPGSLSIGAGSSTFASSAGFLTHSNAYGNIQIGPANTSWGHIYTDRPAFYFNKGATWVGSLLPSAHATYNLGSTSARWNRIYGDNLEVGAVSDTTISRLAAGKIGVEGKAVLTHGGAYTSGSITFSTASPSGGSSGDVWFKYT